MLRASHSTRVTDVLLLESGDDNYTLLKSQDASRAGSGGKNNSVKHEGVNRGWSRMTRGCAQQAHILILTQGERQGGSLRTVAVTKKTRANKLLESLGTWPRAVHVGSLQGRVSVRSLHVLRASSVPLVVKDVQS